MMEGFRSPTLTPEAQHLPPPEPTWEFEKTGDPHTEAKSSAPDSRNPPLDPKPLNPWNPKPLNPRNPKPLNP